MFGRDAERMMDMWIGLLEEIEKAPRYVRKSTDVQVEEQNGTITITAEMAGVDKEEVDIEVSNRTVTITADSERKNFTWDNTFNYEIDPETVKATMVNGILDLTIEKKEKSSAKKVEIE
tara:strand:+ start:542 stop:898 length:357 start_codon:yes stop_codon:yes gene_type:complete